MAIEFRDTMPPGSPFWEKCARHEGSNTARTIGHLFLCDPCARRLTAECFNDRPPIYHGPALDGFCGLCGTRREVALRQWFIHPMCLNVVQSYPKSMAAARFLEESWAEIVEPTAPDLQLTEIDPVRIEAYAPANRAARPKVPAVDFNVQRVGVATPLFLIEMKAGPGAIGGPDGMTEFQLDVNDYVDVVTVMRDAMVPAYVFHVQITDEYDPPTRRSVGRGIWWTDMWTLLEAFKRVDNRRDEQKRAGYFKPTAFKPFVDFPAEVASLRYRELAQRLATEGIADLPRKN